MHSFMPQSLANVTWSYASREKQMHHAENTGLLFIVIDMIFLLMGRKELIMDKGWFKVASRQFRLASHERVK